MVGPLSESKTSGAAFFVGLKEWDYISRIRGK